MANMNVNFTSNAGQIKDAVQLATERALETIGLIAEGYAKGLCPVDTGRLRNSISHAVDVQDKAAIIGTNVEYARYVEFGTSRMSPRPYLAPAVQDHIAEYKQIWYDEIYSV